MVNFAKSYPNAQHRFAPLSIKRDFGSFFFQILFCRPENFAYSSAYCLRIHEGNREHFAHCQHNAHPICNHRGHRV